MRVDADKFLEDATGRYARSYRDALFEMVEARAMGNSELWFSSRQDLARTISETMGIGEVLGASLSLQNAANAAVEVDFQDSTAASLLVFANEPTQTVLPRVTLAEAVEDLVRRTPVTLKAAAERTAEKISQLYSDQVVIAFVKSAEDQVTRAAQSAIRDAVVEGLSEVDAAQRVITSVDLVREKTGPWTESYAKMAFRTNLNTGVTAGRFRQSQDPDVQGLTPAFEFQAADLPVSRGGDTRDNHYAMHGIILRVDNTAWNRLAPPLGYSCRCQVVARSIVQLRSERRIDRDGQVIEDRVPFDAHPDPGFRHSGRPDLFVSRGAR